MSVPLALAFDVGTQSLRGMLVDPDGNTVCLSQKKYETPYLSGRPGYAEQEPEFYFNALCEVSRSLSAMAGGFSAVTAASITSIRDTVLCLDGANAPLRNIIVWLDNREVGNPDPFKPAVKAALGFAGMTEASTAQYNASACNWIMEHQPEIWAKTAKFVMLPTYLHYKLTGVLADCPANQIGHLPFDSRHGAWQKNGALTRAVYDVPLEKLCALVPSGSVVGRITAEAAALSGMPEGLPLVAAGSDKGCETLGLSVIEPHQAALSFGTAATVQFSTSHYFEPQQFMPAYPAAVPGMFNPEIQIYRGYWLISWFKREFALEECAEAELNGRTVEDVLNAHLADVPPGCDGLVLQPYWSPGIVIPSARGAMIGFSDAHTRAHIYRAIIEGLGFALLEGMRCMERRSGAKISALFAGGGGSQSDDICAITANIFGLPLSRIQTHEAAGLGAAISAFVATGLYQNHSEAISKMVRIKDTFMPEPGTHALYEQLYGDVYSEIYKKLEPLYKRLKRMTKR